MQIFKTGVDVYVELPGGNGDRRLHKGQVCESAEDRVSIRMKDVRIGIDSGIDVALYYDLDGGFVRQPAEVCHVDRSRTELRIDLQAAGDPEGAEDRTHVRANTLRRSLSVWMEGGEICRVNDVSSVGLSILSKERLGIGQERRIRIVLDGTAYEGIVQVRSVAPLAAGITRYGMEVGESSPGNLP